MVTEQPSEARLAQLAADVRRHAGLVRYLDHGEVEAAAERLAALLLEAVGLDDLRQRGVSAIPRGGLIAAGLVGYALDLDRRQFRATSSGRPVLVIDDVAYSGKRIGEALDQLDRDDVVVAHLASHPELRKAIEADPRVQRCVAAIDLESPPSPTEDLPAELDSSRYWIGRTNIVAFPWSEPDVRLWEPDGKAFEGGWRVVAPEQCIENRMMLGPPSPDRAGRTYRFPEALAFGWFDESLLVCRLDTERIVGLDPITATLWGALGTLGHIEAATEHAADLIDATPETLRDDLNRLVPELVAAGLLDTTAS